MNLRNLLKHRNSIYGFLSIWIIFFHVNRRLGGPIQIPILKQVVLSGNMGVDIFMFFSGVCLYLSMAKEPNVKEFYKKRVLRLLPSYLMISIPFWVWRSLIEAPKEGGGFHVIRFLGDLSSATFWLTGIETTWFVFAIFVFYLLFPLIFKIVNKGLKHVLALLVFIYALNVIGIYFVPIYEKSSIAWTRLPVFVLGVISGKYIDVFDLERLKPSTRISIWGGVSAMLTLSLIVFPVSEVVDGKRIPSEYMWLLYGPLTVMIVIMIVSLLGPRKRGFLGKLLGTVGGMSLEIYMSHIIILHWLTYYGWLGRLGNWTFAVIMILALVVSYPVFYIFVRKLLKTSMR